MIQRINYLNQLISLQDKDIIKVITGVRRCGKSTLFKQIHNHLIENGVKNEQIISLNLENLDFEELLDYKKLYKYINDRLCKDENTYIFIDEVQNCKNFEKAVDSLFIKDNVDIYITGSNAYMLSGELATLLSGRYIKIDMFPLSFKEYYSHTSKNDILTKNQQFSNYLKFGSFPYVATNLDNNVNEYLDGIYNSILIKDVAKREGITDITLLESIIKTVTSSIGSPVSTKKITDTIISSGRKISNTTVENYIKALCDAYIFYKVDRYDIKGKQHLKTQGKYYIIDTGLRNILISSSSVNLGHQIENITYFELIRRGYKVNIGKISEKEVDFVAVKQSEFLYVQVSASVLDETTLKRELSSLESIKDNHPKILLTLDEIGESNFNGIRHINLIEWLLQ